MYEVYETETFKRIYAKAEHHEMIWIDKVRTKLREYPHESLRDH